MNRVVITGTGALSPLGVTTSALWRGVLDGKPGIRKLARLRGDVTTGGEVDVDHELADRDQQIARVAIEAALREARRDASTTGFLWGTALDTYQNTAAGFVHRSAGDCFSALAAPFAPLRRMLGFACATGTATIGEAFHLVRAGRIDACVAGGSSMMLGPWYLGGFSSLRAIAVDLDGEPPGAACKPFDRKRRGFALADGAGALVVESLASAERRGVEPLAEVLGYGVSQDAFDLNRPPPDGAGARLAMQRALADAHVDDVDAVNAHGTGTVAGDVAEAAALRALLGTKTPVSSIKGAIGHTMAAAGALEAIVAVATCRTGVVPPTTNLDDPDDACALDHVIGRPRETEAKRVLTVSFGMGGQNAALVLGRFA